MGSSPAAWACVAANIGATVGINVVMSWLPAYFEELFLVDLRDFGLVTLVRGLTLVFAVGSAWLGAGAGLGGT